MYSDAPSSMPKTPPAVISPNALYFISVATTAVPAESASPDTVIRPSLSYRNAWKRVLVVLPTVPLPIVTADHCFASRPALSYEKS